MGLREELAELIRLQVGETQLGHEAAFASMTGGKAEGTLDEAIKVLNLYCMGLEAALMHLADEVEQLRL
jgi:hypothetical protein